MPLHINLLHEEQAKIVERKRDPLKIGLLALLLIGLCLYGYLLKCQIDTKKLKGELTAMQDDWARLEPKEIQAKHDEDKANALTASTTIIEKMINDRFYWAPVLAQLTTGTGPEVQISRVEGTISNDYLAITLIIDGISAGKEPRAIAEKLRQTLGQRFEKTIGKASSQFNNLENNAATVTLNGITLETAAFSIEFHIQIQPEIIHAKAQ